MINRLCHFCTDKLLRILPLLIIAVFILLSPLLLTPYTYALLGLSIGSVALLLYRSDCSANRSILFFGVMMTLVAFMSALFSGYFWNGFEYTLVIATVALALAIIPHSNERDGFLYLTLVFAGLGLYFLSDVAINYAEQIRLFGAYGLFRIPVGVFRNPNVLARFFGLAGLICLISPFNRLVKLPLGSFFLLPVFISGSRGAILGLIVALVGYLVVENDKLRINRWMMVLIAVLVLVAVVVLVGRPGYVTNSQRIKLAVESLAMTAENPLLGVGGWNFPLVYPSVSLDGYWQRHPHSVIFVLLTEFGLLGFSVFVVGLLFLCKARFNQRWVPVLLFVGIHELVDTMVWIPGVLILTLLALRPLSQSSESTERSPLLVATGIFVVIASLLVLTVDIRHQKALLQDDRYNLELGTLETVAVFPNVHGLVDRAKRGKEIREERLSEVLYRNEYDPYYMWLTGRILIEQGKEEIGNEAIRRSAKMDPKGMLGLHESGERKENSDTRASFHISDVSPPSLWNLWKQSANPLRYVPVVVQSMRKKQYKLANRQLQYLRSFPKTNDKASDQISHLEQQLPLQFQDSTRAQPPDVHRLRRQQFHRFFYRRSGQDYVSFH